MNMDWITLGTVAFVSLLLAIFLGRMYRPKDGGFTSEDTREVLAIVLVVAILIMVATGREVPDFLVAAFGAVVSSIILKPVSVATVLRPSPEARIIEASDPRSGRTSLNQLLLMLGVALLGLGLCVGLSACTAPQVRAIRPLANKAADQVGARSWLDGFRHGEGEVYAEDMGLISTQGMERTLSGFAVDENRYITGRVQIVETLRFYHDPIGPAPKLPDTIPAPPTGPVAGAGAGPIGPLPATGTLNRISGPTTGGVAL